MPRGFLLALCAIALISCSQDRDGFIDAPRPVLLAEDTVLDLYRTVLPGAALAQVQSGFVGPRGSVLEPGTFPEVRKPTRTVLATTVYGRPADVEFLFDEDGLYDVAVRIPDLPPGEAEVLRSVAEAYYAPRIPLDRLDPGTGWELDLHGISAGAPGVMTVSWEFLAPGAGTVRLMAGEPDGFREPYDLSNRNPDIVDFILTTWLGQSIREFDQPGNDRALVHRFTDLPDGPYCNVRLLLRLRGQTSSLSSNDSIRLVYPAEAEGTSPFAWWRPIRAFTGTWGVGRDISLDIDLSNLPLDADGETTVIDRIAGNVLDVVVEDDTAVDFMMLRVRTTGHRGHGPHCEG